MHYFVWWNIPLRSGSNTDPQTKTGFSWFCDMWPLWLANLWCHQSVLWFIFIVQCSISMLWHVIIFDLINFVMSTTCCLMTFMHWWIVIKGHSFDLYMIRIMQYVTFCNYVSFKECSFMAWIVYWFVARRYTVWILIILFGWRMTQDVMMSSEDVSMFSKPLAESGSNTDSKPKTDFTF